MFRKIIPIIILGLLFSGFHPQPVYSDTACTASVSPTALNINSTFTLDFTVNGVLSFADVAWVKITRPNANYTLVSTDEPDWTTSGNSGSFEFTGNAIPSDASDILSLVVSTGTTESGSDAWLIQASEFDDGSSPVTCSGNPITSLASGSATGDEAYPSISSITVTEVTTSSAKISWMTQKAANSVLEYGLNPAYGLTVNSSSLKTSHSLAVSGLSADTTYHYRVSSTDDLNQTTYSANNTFTTAKQSSGVTTTPTPTVTPTPRPLPSTSVSPTPTPLVDSQAPIVALTTDLSRPVKQAVVLNGSATDNNGVEKIEYSTDNGNNWLPVDLITTPGGVRTTFSFLPQLTEDGNYQIRIKATDVNGLTSISTPQTLVIDRLSPRVGASLIAIGPHILEPNENKPLFGLVGINQKITLSAVGGPTTIDVLAAKNIFSLAKNPDNGLWSGALSFEKEGVYQLTARSTDGAKNQTSRRLSTIAVLKNGRILSDGKAIPNAKVSVYTQESTSERFGLWKGEPYGQVNPQTTDKDGNYQLLLPEGKYYLTIQASSFRTLKTNIFSITQSRPVNTDFNLEKSLGIRIGSFSLSLPTLQIKEVSVDLKLPDLPVMKPNRLIDRPLSEIELKDEEGQNFGLGVLGKPTVVTVLNTWSTLAVGQLRSLEQMKAEGLNLVIVIPHESASSVEIFKRRGNYGLDLIADPDGELANKIGLEIVPTHLFLNRRGVVQKVLTGNLSESELLENLIQ